MSAFVELERERYAPGDVLRAAIRLEPLPGDEGRRVEASVLWETSGKGDTDAGVILHSVLSSGDGLGARATHRLEVEPPALPFSHRGRLIKIGWCVRVRRLSRLGRDEVYDYPFELGGPA